MQIRESGPHQGKWSSGAKNNTENRPGSDYDDVDQIGSPQGALSLLAKGILTKMWVFFSFFIKTGFCASSQHKIWILLSVLDEA